MENKGAEGALLRKYSGLYLESALFTFAGNSKPCLVSLPEMAAETMSSEDFRAHLYHSLQGKGILNSLKVCENASSHFTPSFTVAKFTVTTEEQTCHRAAEDTEWSWPSGELHPAQAPQQVHEGASDGQCAGRAPEDQRV